MSRSNWKAIYVDINIIRRFDELVLNAIADFKQRYKLQNENIPVTTQILKQNILEISTLARSFSEEMPIEVWSRNSVILPEFLGFFFIVHNGHVFQKLLVKQNMLGKKFGEFAITKRIGTNIHYPKKKKKRN
jgi:small subunit ribosomal protein S19